MLSSLFRPRAERLQGQALYAAVVAQARRPEFFSSGRVADTVEARFELYTLHVSLLVLRLQGAGEEAEATSQALFDAYLQGLDDALRELGVGDLSMAKKMRKLGSQAYERLRLYREALGVEAPGDAMTSALRQCFGRDAPIALLSPYAAACRTRLKEQPLKTLLADGPDWPPVKETDHG